MQKNPNQETHRDWQSPCQVKSAARDRLTETQCDRSRMITAAKETVLQHTKPFPFVLFAYPHKHKVVLSPCDHPMCIASLPAGQDSSIQVRLDRKRARITSRLSHRICQLKGGDYTLQQGLPTRHPGRRITAICNLAIDRRHKYVVHGQILGSIRASACKAKGDANIYPTYHFDMVGTCTSRCN